MKYKVGDKVKVRSDLKCEEYYGGITFNFEMNKFKGMEITIARVNYGGYYEVLETPYNFTDEMLEPVEGMSAEEAIRLQGEICMSLMCRECPIDKLREDSHLECAEFRAKHPEEIAKILKQWKRDCGKKDVEVEFARIVRVIEDTGDVKKCVYEEDIPYSEDWEEAQVRVLKEYCKDRNGKFFAVMDSICRVKE